MRTAFDQKHGKFLAELLRTAEISDLQCVALAIEHVALELAQTNEHLQSIRHTLDAIEGDVASLE